jgi:hypothetical protein
MIVPPVRVRKSTEKGAERVAKFYTGTKKILEDCLGASGIDPCEWENSLNYCIDYKSGVMYLHLTILAHAQSITGGREQ